MPAEYCKKKRTSGQKKKKEGARGRGKPVLQKKIETASILLGQLPTDRRVDSWPPSKNRVGRSGVIKGSLNKEPTSIDRGIPVREGFSHRHRTGKHWGGRARSR